MTGKDLFDAVHQCEDQYIEQTAGKLLKSERKNRKISMWFFQRESTRETITKATVIRRMAAVLLCVFVLGMGISALAMASDAFRKWIQEIFPGHEVTELSIGNTGTGNAEASTESLPDIPADKNHRISLKDNMIVWGDRETVVAETHYDKKKEQIIFDRVYRVQGNGLKKLTINSYDGDYDGEPFSFKYVVGHQEIFGFNLEGAIGEVFGYVDAGDRSIYVKLLDNRGKQNKECIAKINLDTLEMEKLSGDQMYADCVISPGGTKMLCLYRADNYASVLDLKTKKEKKIAAVNGISRADEIEFTDDNTILTYGDYVDEVTDGTTYSQQQIRRVDLRTGEVTDTYTGIGDVSLEWESIRGEPLTLRNIVTGDTFSVEGTDAEIHFLKKAGDYALFGNKEKNTSYFIVNLSSQKSMAIDVPKEIYHQVEIYLAGPEKKLLLVGDTEGYIVDVSYLAVDEQEETGSGPNLTAKAGKQPGPATESDKKPDIPTDENQMLTLKKDMRIYGERESFVCQVYENENEEDVIDAVYAIEEDGLRRLKVKSFSGEYDGVPYSFSYAAIGNEVFGFNETGYCEVLPYKKGDVIYAAFSHVNKNSRVTRECLAKINLETKEVTPISGDQMICNFLMSPDGKIILCNHRSDEYWSVFDIASRTEKRIDSLAGYLHTDEIKFLDTYTVLAYGDSIETTLPDGSVWMDSQTYKIDLRTGEILEKYPGTAELDMEWDYTTKGDTLQFDNIVTGESFTINGVGENVYTLSGTGSYFLFGYDEDEEEQSGTAYCLVNLAEQTFMKIHMPKELYFDVEMYLTVSEKKLFLTNGTEAYIVDVSELG